MALAPDSSENFAREVDENLRRDQARDFAQKYGRWLIVAAVLLLAAVGGWLYWQHRQDQQAQRQSEELSQVYGDIARNQMQTVPPRLQALGQSDNDVIRASALLTEAALALEKNDRATALNRFKQISGDGSLPQPYRDLAIVRSTTLEFDTLKPEEIIARLQPLAQSGKPWFGSAGELTAMAYLRQNQPERAGKLFAAIAADPQVPATMRSRAVQIAGTLGVDASASLPGISQ
ncbi:MAG: tetratricopeptide repeat protein [Pseudomonadota bacterium]|nr:tetratricopeptide repeat protein [Pseudomonadota bacterium]